MRASWASASDPRSVGFRKRDVEQQLVRDGEQLDRKAKPNPAHLVPRATRGQHRLEEAPVQVPSDEEPNHRKYEKTRPPSFAWQERPECIDKAHDEQRWRDKAEEIAIQN